MDAAPVNAGDRDAGAQVPAPDGLALRTRVWRRLRPLLGALAIIGALIAWFAGNMWIANSPLGTFSTDVHVDLQFLGETATSASVDVSDVQLSLLLDCVVAIAYGLVFFVVLGVIKPPDHIDPRLVKIGRSTRSLPLVAGGLDVIENLLLIVSIEAGAGDTVVVSPPWLGWVVTAIAIAKWVALGASLLVVVWWGAITVSPRPVLRRPDDEPAGGVGSAVEPGGLAVCCSGGGIRSAGFSIGALRALEEAGVMERVDTLAAVSGGNYAATGWTTHRHAGGEGFAADRLIVRLLGSNPLLEDGAAILNEQARIEQARATTAKAAALRPADAAAARPAADGSPADQLGDRSVRSRPRPAGRHRFLLNGPGGLRRALLWAGAAIAGTIAQIVVITVAIGWPLGYVLASDVMYPDLADALLDGTGTLAIDTRHWAPIVILLGLGVVAWLASALVDDDAAISPTRRRIATSALLVSGGAIGVGLAAGLVLIVAPWLLVQVYAIGSGANESPLFTVGGISLLTVLGVIYQVIRNPLRSRWSKLGGAALALVVIALVGKVARDAATGDGLFGDPWVALVAALVLVVVTFLPDTQTWSIRELYRARLTRSFTPEEFQPKPWSTRARSTTDHPAGVEWTELGRDEGAPRVPELVVCCAASRVGLSTSGVSAESFTISQHEVRHHRATGDVTVPTGRYLARLRSWALIPLRSPAGWMSTSGAAVASGMGRTGLGSTNALLAAVNADLGVWLPAPGKVAAGHDVFPPVRIGHLIAEIFGLYAEQDEFVFVSDGGHLENLGLVEALRHRPRTVICVDASGDEPGTFATFRSALQMADTELEERLRFDLRELDASPTPAATAVYRIPFGTWKPPGEPESGDTGVIIFLKLQNTLDQPLPVRQMANADPRFPNYSTANQLLDDQQFIFLLFAGYHAGRIAARVAAERLEAFDGERTSPAGGSPG